MVFQLFEHVDVDVDAVDVDVRACAKTRDLHAVAVHV